MLEVVVEEVGRRGEGMKVGGRRRNGKNDGEETLFIGRRLDQCKGARLCQAGSQKTSW